MEKKLLVKLPDHLDFGKWIDFYSNFKNLHILSLENMEDFLVYLIKFQIRIKPEDLQKQVLYQLRFLRI